MTLEEAIDKMIQRQLHVRNILRDRVSLTHAQREYLNGMSDAYLEALVELRTVSKA